MDYRRIWSETTGLTIPNGWHIHHIDGDHLNNNPENLRCVSPTMHWYAHLLLGDIKINKGKHIFKAGGPKTDATCRQISESKKGKTPKGNVYSLEINQKRSDKLKGRTRPLGSGPVKGKTPGGEVYSEDTNRRRSQALKGKPKSEAHRLAISLGKRKVKV